MTTLVRIGSTNLYSETTISSVLDGHALSEFDSTTLGEMFPVSNLLQLACEALTIDHDIGGRSTAALTICDSAGAYTFTERQQIQIYDEDHTPDFAGVVLTCEEYRIPGTDYVFHTVDAADYTSLCDWRVVDYAAENTLAGTAVEAIWSEYLEEEGVTIGYIEGGELLTEISIGNKSVTEAFDKLAEACNFIWYIDYDLKLYFHSRTLYAADWSISDLTDILGDSLSITRQNAAYRNREIVIGGYEETSEQTESFVTDGTTKSFALGYKVNRVTSVTVNAAAQTVGRKGTDAGSYDCYYDVQSETLTFDAAPPTGTGTIVYYGLWQSKAVAEDLTAISDNATRQGFGSGKIEHVTTDQALTSITAAGEYANAKLSEYAQDGITVSYKTLRTGLAAGTLQSIAVAGLSDDFLITNVSQETKDTVTTYSVTAVSGPVDDSWESWFHQELFTGVTEVREGVEDSGVTKLYSFSHTYEAADRPNPFTEAAISTGLAVSDDTWPCFEEADRASYIEFWNDGACVFRKQHTSAPDLTEDDEFNSYSYIAPAECNYEMDEVVWFGGDSATATTGTGVELYRAAFVKTKTILESYQVNMEYINGA